MKLRDKLSNTSANLIAQVLKMDIREVYAQLHRTLTTDEIIKIDRVINGIPVGRVCKTQIFYGHSLIIRPGTFDPRPATERLIDYVRYNLMPQSILDVCTGSGAILLSLLQIFKNARGVGTDISEYAIQNAIENAAQMNIDRCNFIQTNFTDNITEYFDVVISNPPYVIGALDVSAKFDPPIALFDNNAYSTILQNHRVKLHGYLIFEVPRYISFEYPGFRVVQKEQVDVCIDIIVLQRI